MQPIVYFRNFIESDIQYIYKWKNEKDLSTYIVGRYRPFSYKEAEDWVKNCMVENDSYKFWAICSIDTNQIIGWCAIANIDSENRSAKIHSIVIADKNFNDGLAWIEALLHLFRYAFEILNLHRLWGECLETHPVSSKRGALMYMHREGVLRDAFFKDNRYIDILYDAILDSEYFTHKENGDYNMMNLIKRLRKLRHE